MARIRTIGPREARGEVQSLYRLVLTAFPLVPNVFQAFSLRPPLLRAVWEGHRATLQTGSLARSTKEILAVQTSRANACPYCVGAHTMFLRALGMSEARIAALDGELAGEREGPLADLWRFVEEAVQRPGSLPAPLAAAALRTAESERAFLEAVAVLGFFTRVNLVVNALDVRPDLPAPLLRFGWGQRLGRAMASRLTRARVDLRTRTVDARPAPETLALIEEGFGKAFGAPLPAFFRRFAETPEILDAEAAWLGAIARPSFVPPDWAPLLEAAAAEEEGFERFGGGKEDGQGLADGEALRAGAVRFTRRVVAAAHRVTDADLDALRESGFQDEAILEIVASAAYWRGTRRMAAALEAAARR